MTTTPGGDYPRIPIRETGWPEWACVLAAVSPVLVAAVAVAITWRLM